MRTIFDRIIPALTLTIGLAFAMPATAQKTTFRVLADDFEHFKVEFTTGALQTGEISIGGETFSTLAIEGYQQPSANYGSPALPTFSQLIEVPLGAEFEVKVSDAVYDTLAPLKHRLMPVQLPRRKSDTTEQKLFINHDVYTWNTFVGQSEAVVEAVGVARDRRLARLQFSPVRYNPVSGKLIVCRHATVTVNYRNADKESSLAMFERYHTPAFNSGTQVMNNLYPKAVRTAAPVRYLIVAHSMFRGHLNEFVQWKQRKGFRVDVAYTDDPAVGTDTTSIRNYIRSQYTDATLANPAPTYVLLVGDVAQIPPFIAHVTSPSTGHVTDLYYMTWTNGDHIPDCYYGRFSAQNLSQLTPQIEKTLMYEQYTFADPSFLDRAVMVAGVDQGNTGDNGYTYADPTLDYAITNYVNGAHGFANVYYFKNNVSIVPSGVTNVTVSSSASGNAATVRQYYNLGAGLINYTAHGGSTGWGTPNFGNSHVNQMTNNQKFGLMIGNCCQTNMFGESTCFGEALLRKNEYAGAVGYIGGSNYTYWGQDFYWSVGVRSSIGPTMSMAYNASNLGIYDRTFHTHGEAFAQWCTTQGSLVFQGNMAVEASSSGSNMKWYYWEIYHLMGDPSVMPYMTQADSMSVAVSSSVPYGTTSLTVSAVPNAYVALTDTVTNTLIAAVFANTSGNATLTLPADLSAGTYLLAVSAQQYRTAFLPVTILLPEGAYPVVTSITSAPLNAGDTVALTLHYENSGTETARNIMTQLTCNNPLLTFSVSSVNLDSLVAGETRDVTVVDAYVAANTPDNTFVDITAGTNWTGSTITATNTMRKWLYAPVLSLTFVPSNPSLMPGASSTVTAKLRNSGHAYTKVNPMTFISPTSLLTITPAVSTPFSLAMADDTTVSLTIQASSQLVEGMTIPVNYCYGTFEGTLPVFVGTAYMETFEGGSMNLSGWSSPASYPWVIIDSQAVSGTYCLRSSPNLTHRNTSEITFTTNVTIPDSISFFYRVSSENNYDKFFFLIDGEEKFNASGDGDWTRAAYPLTTGSHVLTFRYTKDYSVSNGSDCAWIDNVVLPHHTLATTFFHYDTCSAEAIPAIVQSSSQSITVTDYITHPIYLDDTNKVTACDNYFWHGEEYTSSAFLTDSSLSVYGCDSITTINLTVNYSSVGDTAFVTTTTSPYEWNGTDYDISGTYQQTLVNAQGCDSTVTLVLTIDESQGIDGLATDAITLYPNPTASEVYFTATVSEVVVYDMLGHELLRRHNVQSLDLATLPQGTYLLRLTQPGSTSTRRIVKQ